MAYAPSWLIRGFQAAAAIVRHPAVQLTVVAIATVDQASRIIARPTVPVRA